MRFRGGSADGSQRKYSETVLVPGTPQRVISNPEALVRNATYRDLTVFSLLGAKYPRRDCNFSPF